MDIKKAFKVLGIGEGSGEQEITDAYRSKVIEVNPEDDPEGFKNLREAYERAMAYARDKEGGSGDEDAPDGEADLSITEGHSFGPDIDGLMVRFARIYDDIDTRMDKEAWDMWLSDPLCTGLDTANTVREAVLAAMMSRYVLPGYIWKAFNEAFGITYEREQLSEVFPEDFIDYVCDRIESDAAFRYEDFISREELIRGVNAFGFTRYVPDKEDAELSDEPSGKNDNYLLEMARKMNDIAYALDPRNEESRDEALGVIAKRMGALQEADIYHPDEEAVLMTVLYHTGRRDEALEIALNVLKNDYVPGGLPGPYIRAAFTLIQCYEDDISSGKATLMSEEPGLRKVPEYFDEALIEKALSKGPWQGGEGYYEMIPAVLTALRGDLAEGERKIIYTLNEYSIGNNDLGDQLRWVSSMLVKFYKDKLDAEPDMDSDEFRKNSLELAWAYYRQEMDDEVIDILSSFTPGPDEEYGYNSMLGRIYSKREEYDKACTHLKKWNEIQMKIIEENKDVPFDELPEQTKGRIGNAAFALSSLAVAEHLTGDEESAEMHFREALKMAEDKERSYDNKNVPYYMNSLALFLDDMGRYREEIEVYNEFDERFGAPLEVLIRRQKAAAFIGETGIVFDDFYKIINIAPQYGDAYAAVGHIYLEYGRVSDVKKTLDMASEAGAESDFLEVLRARLLISEDDKEGARDIFKALMEKVERGESDEYRIPFFYAWEILKNESIAEAEKCYLKAREMFPRQRTVNNELMKLSMRKFRQTEERKYADDAYRYAELQLRNLANSYFFVDTALMYNETARFQKGAEYAELAVKADSENEYAYNALGVALMMMGRYDEAEEALKKGISLLEKNDNEKFTGIIDNYAQCLERERKFSEALDVRKLLLEKDDTIFARTDLGHNYRYLGLFSEEMEQLLTARDMIKREAEDGGSSGDHPSFNDLQLIQNNVYIMENAFLAGNETLLNEYLKETDDYIDKNDLLSSKISGTYKIRILICYGEYCLYTLRDYKKARKVLSAAFEAAKADNESLMDSARSAAFLIDSLLRLSGETHFGKKYLTEARETALWIDETIKKLYNGDIDTFLNYPANAPKRHINYAIIRYALRDRDGAIKILGGAKRAALCRYCNHPDCYEERLMLARIYEIERNFSKALEMYEAASNSMNADSEVVAAIRSLKKRK